MSHFGLRNVVFKRKWGERGKWGSTCAPRPAPTSAEVAPPHLLSLHPHLHQLRMLRWTGILETDRWGLLLSNNVTRTPSSKPVTPGEMPQAGSWHQPPSVAKNTLQCPRVPISTGCKAQLLR